MQPIPTVSAFYSPLQLMKYMFKSDLNLEIEQSKTFHFFGLIKSLTETGWVFWVIVLTQYEALPNESGGIFLNIGRRDGLYPYKLILLLSSYIKSSVKWMRLYAWGSFAVSIFFLHILLSHHLDKGSSLSHRSINTVSKLFWLTFVFFCKL